MDTWLGPDGKLAETMPGYEHRQGQLAMAEAVCTAIEDQHTLLCEAGTGTGKTLAYLVPAILSGKKIVVSTATKALQDQILTKDIPAIEKYLDLHPKVAVAKGLNNYLCRRKFQLFRSSAAASERHHARTLRVLDRWIQTTKTGDVGELADLAEGDRTWREVCSSSDTRRGTQCPFHDRCFVTLMRREAEKAQIVVANHHLVFADMALRAGSQERGGALPTYEALIFDEAHQLEDIAGDFFGERISNATIDSVAREAQRAFASAGLSDELLGTSDATSIVEPVKKASDSLFAAAAAELIGSDRPERKMIPADTWSGPLNRAYHLLDASLESLQAFCASHREDDDVAAVQDRTERTRHSLSRIVDQQDNEVTWIQRHMRSISLGLTPIEVSEVLREQLFERIPTVVLTSATLATSSGFSFVRKRLGTDTPHTKLVELKVPSPFDFRSQALLYVPKNLPEPSAFGYRDRALDEIERLIQITDGGALVLCTSYRMMTHIHEGLQGRTSRLVLAQGQAPKTTLLEQLRTEKTAVLVATMSFWEGVDVAGEALRLVIIDKIPFAVPTDPVVAARCAALEAEGRNAFAGYHLPAAAFTLKQGFGRLIRTDRDRGIVAILDSRLVHKNYGRTLLANLPPAARTWAMENVLDFWNKKPAIRNQ